MNDDLEMAFTYLCKSSGVLSFMLTLRRANRKKIEKAIQTTELALIHLQNVRKILIDAGK